MAIFSGVCLAYANYFAIHVAMANMTFMSGSCCLEELAGKGRTCGFPKTFYTIKESLRNFSFY